MVLITSVLVLPKVFWSKADVNPDCLGYTIEECSKHTWQRRLISYESWVKQKNHNNYAAYKALSFLNEWKFIFCCLFISTEWISGMFLLINYFNIAGMLLSVGMGKSKKTDKSLSQIKNYQKSLVTIVLNYICKKKKQRQKQQQKQQQQQPYLWKIIFYIIPIKHSIVAISKPVLGNPVAPGRFSLGAESGHLGPASKIYLKPLLGISLGGHPTIRKFVQPTIAGTIVWVVNAGSGDGRVRDFAIFHTQTFHTRWRFWNVKTLNNKKI